MLQKRNIKLKQTVSVLLGVPAALVAAMEIDDLRFVWCRFAALAVVVAIVAWNGRKETRNA